MLEDMQKGYYLCKVCTLKTLYKTVYEAKVLYWDKKWLDKEGSYFVTKDEDVLSYLKIPDSYYQTIIV